MSEIDTLQLVKLEACIYNDWGNFKDHGEASCMVNHGGEDFINGPSNSPGVNARVAGGDGQRGKVSVWRHHFFIRNKIT